MKIKDEYGFTGLGMALVAFICIILLFSFIFGMAFVEDYQNMKVFNRYHGTNYEYYPDWFWGEDVIKEYVEGKTLNLNINEEIK